MLGDLIDAFDESDLPFRVDIVDWVDLSPKFRELVESGPVETIYTPDTTG